MTARYLIGDVFDRLAELPDDSVDLVFSSPPFLALRSYLPADHPDKGKEIGSEATPAAFLDTLLDVVEACDRVLAPHGTLIFELGDSYSSSGGITDNRETSLGGNDFAPRLVRGGGAGWPLDKSLCMIPGLFAASLAYGRNLLRAPLSAREMLDRADLWATDLPGLSATDLVTMLRDWLPQMEAIGPYREREPWRIRNLIAWCRPNPPVGALGDKFRPGTSYLTVACKARDRYFDLDAVRSEHKRPRDPDERNRRNHGPGVRTGDGDQFYNSGNPAGAPPLDWWAIPTEPYEGSHYATWPRALCVRPIKAMSPERVCRTCGQPSRRITRAGDDYAGHLGESWADRDDARPKAANRERNSHSGQPKGAHITAAQYETLGWSDCGHNLWRPGCVLDPFAGSGTTLAVATGHGRDAIGIDLDPRNADLALERVGPLFLTIDTGERDERGTEDVATGGRV